MDYIIAIQALVPEIEDIGGYPFDEESFNDLRWQTGIEKPTHEEVLKKIAELTAAEPLRQLRIQRDQLLSATDWWCVSDRQATPEQLAYRQALRDLPATQTPALDENGNLTGVTWPTKPE